MDENELGELANRVRNELSRADVYTHPIPENSIKQVRDYFSKQRGLQLLIQSSYITNPADLSKKYTVIFSRAQIGVN